MNTIIVTTESCSDFPAELKRELGIQTVPLHIHFPEENVFDGSIPVEKIYEFYRKTKNIPKSSAVNPTEFEEFFRRVSRENDNAEIIHIAYTSKCSCTYQNAVLAAKECGGKVHVVDSLNVSGGIGTVTLIAAYLAKKYPEKSAEELVREIEGYSKRIVMWFVPDQLGFLAAGGRVSNRQALGASVLKLKPRIDILDGELLAAKKYRGSMSRVSEKMVKEFVETNDLMPDLVQVLYSKGAEAEILDSMENGLREAGFSRILQTEIGCLMSMHSGPGAVGLVGIRKEA